MTPPGPLLRRIRIATSADIDPSGVETLVTKCEIGHGIYHGLSGEWKLREDARAPPPDSFFWNVVGRLGFDREKEEEWVKGLTWRDPNVIAETNAAQLNGDRHQAAVYQSTLFAHYAAAILITQCPNITHLVVTYSICKKSRFCRQLTTPWVTNDFYIRMDVLAQFHMFHRLPALRNFTTFAVEPSNRTGFEPAFTPYSSDVTKLSVTHSILPGSVMAGMIRLPRALEEFICTTGGRAKSDGGYYAIFPETIGRALWCQRKSLVKLDLDLDDHVLDRYEDYGVEDDEDEENGRETEDDGDVDKQLPWDRGVRWGINAAQTRDLETGRIYGSTLGSLHDFEQLTHLSIGIQMLFGPSSCLEEETSPFRLVDALPSSLEFLLIRGYKRGEVEGYDVFVDEFLAAREERLPKLSVTFGIEEMIPSAKDVDHPGENKDQLWESPSFDDNWEEW